MRALLTALGVALLLATAYVAITSWTPVYLSVSGDLLGGNLTIYFEGDGTYLLLRPVVSYSYDVGEVSWAYVEFVYTLKATAPVALYMSTPSGLVYVGTGTYFTGRGWVNASTAGIKYSIPAVAYGCNRCSGTLTLTNATVQTYARGTVVNYSVDIKYTVSRG